MKHVFLFAALFLVAMTAFAENPTFLNPQDMKWGAAPPSVPKGAKLAVLYGDPSKEGAYAFRAKLPAGYVLPPHFHTKDENLTVLSGALYLGMSDTLDKKSAHVLKSGGFHHLPGKVHHYAYTKTATLIQVSGDGPFDINYLNPADDPQAKK
ncbi:cupin domain-containing protein [Collimonas silvisoli]|uniref:cupin domain-containing protein n=1 Tax=Collimonas silvisoli TaxID=2825884 RepID=UPI001B8C235F|nr:cupin domain-containing protein [Collimonas silvisoli]